MPNFVERWRAEPLAPPPGAAAAPAPLEALTFWPSDVPLAAWFSRDAIAPPSNADADELATWLGPWSFFAPSSPDAWIVGEPALGRLRDQIVAPVRADVPATGRQTGVHRAAMIPPAPMFLVCAYTVGGHFEPRAASPTTSEPLRGVSLLSPPWLLAHRAGPSPSWWCLGPGAGAIEAARSAFARLCTPSTDAATRFELSPLCPEPDRAHAQRRYINAVRAALARIDAGDVYQVNLAHRLTASLSGSPRALARAWFAAATPRYPAYADLPDRTLISASPELFLHIDATTARARTRPMKGTRPRSRAEDAASAELRASEKENAELNMIVDLMRNDLGRLSIPGSVVVERPRDIEAHGSAHAGGVLQATATVASTLEPGTSLERVLASTFPPGSVTGAPKISAMRIIAELETASREQYCGCMGLLLPDGSATLSVAIRTAILPSEPAAAVAGPRVLHYSVGAGIVADSEPHTEWAETLVKAATLRSLSGGADEVAEPTTLTPKKPSAAHA